MILLIVRCSVKETQLEKYMSQSTQIKIEIISIERTFELNWKSIGAEKH